MIAPNYALIGLDWYDADEEVNYREVNVYILFIKLSFYW
jgi:hypothetical protein